MTATVDDFEIKDAVRVAQSVSIGIVGPSGCGKTLSALRLAMGMRSVIGGDVHVIDTEATRALDYTDDFKFKHIDFKGPFGSDRYLLAIEKCRAAGAKIIIVDSLSHEHESEGGLLEQFDAELKKLGGGENQNARAWIKPKALRRRLVVRMEQMRDVNFILTFRAADQTKPGPKGSKEYIHMGFMPIGGREFVYSTKATALLLAGADGVPTWNPEHIGEKLMRKLPNYLKGILADGNALSEDHGRKIMEWARRGSAPLSSSASIAGAVKDIASRFAAAKDAIKSKNTEVGVEKAWALTKGLRAELDPDSLEDLTMTYEGRLNDLKEGAPA